MNPSTASARLVKDILYKFIKDAGHTCHKCGQEMSRDTFSIEHKEPWLDSEDPLGMFFDLENIAFSHLKCNVGARRKEPAKHGTLGKYDRGCRCTPCKEARSAYVSVRYTPEKRRNQYMRTGT